MKTDYQQKVEDFLVKHGIKFTITFIGNDCPAFCEDARAGKDMSLVGTFPRRSHIHGRHYRCELLKKDYFVYFDFWNSYRNEELNYIIENRDWFYHPESLSLDSKRLLDGHGLRAGYSLLKGLKKVKVEAYDLLSCLQKSEIGTFQNFCNEFGYDSDSIRALKTYESVCGEYQKVKGFFTSEELKELQEIS